MAKKPIVEGSLISNERKHTNFEVHDTIKDTKRMKPYLKQAWCECEQPEFLCYPEDGCCTCGEYKHHVHCTCGSISQTG
jgi:hypothetical protein